MELAKILNEEISFDPTPKLKSSPIPITFVSFDKYDNNCIYCGEGYTSAFFSFQQKYCKKCLSSYLANITDKNTYLDVYFNTRNSECSEHEIIRTSKPQCVQECCKNCLEILYLNKYLYVVIFVIFLHLPIIIYTII